MWGLSHKQKFLFAIVVVYLCSTAFGILNGLIGIFGDIFNDNSDEIFVKNDVSDERVDELSTVSSLLKELEKINENFDSVNKRLSELS